MQPPSVGHNSEKSIRFELVKTPQQLVHATAVRAICFMEEHGVPADLLFDGNDYMATHVVIYNGDEPIGSSRVRWFKEFAKIERTCFRKDYRSIGILKAFAAFGYEHIARKGYTRVITHASVKYARLWKTVLGFKSSDKEPAYFEGNEPYYEIWKDIEPAADPIGLSTSCMVLFRTEGQWDEPGAFERQ